MKSSQFNFFSDDIDEPSPLTLIEGFSYEPELISLDDERALASFVSQLPFREFEFHGYLGKRRVVSFGYRYDYSGGGKLLKADQIPDLLLELRSQAARFARLRPEALQQVLVTEYTNGAGIGWHRDKSVFGEVVGISLLAPCVLRLRKQKPAPKGARPKAWERVNVEVQPRSAYVLSGPARLVWEHSISRVDALRYAITFRNVKEE